MVNKILHRNFNLSLARIRDYILKYFPDNLWWDGYSKHETFRSYKSYKHRQGMPNEIRIEFDSDNIDNNFDNVNLTCVNLTKLGYSFAIFYVEGGRSPHIHIYDLDELENYNKQQRNDYRIQFLKSVCPKNSKPDFSLCDEKHLCALEFALHFKYHKPKKLLYVFFNGYNQSINTRIIKKEKIKEDNISQKKLNFGDKVFNNKRDLIIGNCSFEKVFDKYNINYRGNKALCPFHLDTDKSLSFSNEKGLWNCFGCHKKGDVITLMKLLMEKNGR